jgi:hypothetical protein
MARLAPPPKGIGTDNSDPTPSGLNGNLVSYEATKPATNLNIESAHDSFCRFDADPSTGHHH